MTSVYASAVRLSILLAAACTILSPVQSVRGQQQGFRRRCADPFNPNCMSAQLNPGARLGGTGGRTRPNTGFQFPSLPFIFGGSGLGGGGLFRTPPPPTTTTPAPPRAPGIGNLSLVKPADYPSDQQLIQAISAAPEFVIQSETSINQCLCSCDPNPVTGADGCHNNVSSSSIKPYQGYNHSRQKRHIVQLPSYGIDQHFDIVRCAYGSKCLYGDGDCQQVECLKPLITYSNGRLQADLFRYPACCACKNVNLNELLQNRRQQYLAGKK